MSNPFEDAIQQERRVREEAYLTTGALICGIPIKQVTPSLLALLNRMKTPLLTGFALDASDDEVLRFIWALHRDRKPSFASIRRWWFLFTFRLRIWWKSDFSFDQARVDLSDFIEDTLQDAPEGDACKPYSSTIANLEFIMAGEPFCWDYDTKTAHVPLRRIYQLIRCRQLSEGKKLNNRLSDGLLNQALKEANEDETAMASRKAQFDKIIAAHNAAIEARRLAQNGGNN